MYKIYKTLEIVIIHILPSFYRDSVLKISPCVYLVRIIGVRGFSVVRQFSFIRTTRFIYSEIQMKYTVYPSLLADSCTQIHFFDIFKNWNYCGKSRVEHYSFGRLQLSLINESYFNFLQVKIHKKYDFYSIYWARTSITFTDGTKSIYVRVYLIICFQMIPSSTLYDDFWSRNMRSRYQNLVAI